MKEKRLKKEEVEGEREREWEERAFYFFGLIGLIL